MVWSVITYVVVLNKTMLICVPDEGKEIKSKEVYNMKKVKEKNERKPCEGGNKLLLKDSHINRTLQPKTQP